MGRGKAIVAKFEEFSDGLVDASAAQRAAQSPVGRGIAFGFGDPVRVGRVVGHDIVPSHSEQVVLTFVCDVRGHRVGRTSAG